MAIYRGTGLQGEGEISDFSQLVQDAQDAAAAAEQAYEDTIAVYGSITAVNNAVTAAQLAEANAETAEANAELAETNAETAATNAANSASAASTSATNAASSATSASNSASTATTQATNAANSATAAATSASNASTSATNAANSATTATNQATNAATSATSAANSATTATNSANTAISKANEASASAAAASASASSASSSAVLAATSAAEAVDHLNEALDLYNGAAALEDAVDAAQASATASANSATASANSATQATINGAVQVALATTQATNAANSATAAATSATNAANSATQAAASASSAAAIVTGVASNRASVRPSLLLAFANTKQLDPRITFSRASTGTYYDGKTVVKAEENLFPFSQDFDNASWIKLRSTVTANTTTAPDGTSTADSLLQQTGQTTIGAVYYDITCQAAPYTLSIYAKPNGKNFIRVATTLATGNLEGCYFNVSAGTVGTADAGITGSISAAPNGYYRCAITFTANAARSGSNRIFVADSDNSSTVVDSGGVYIWGAQLEQRSTVTAYTPTTTAPITNYIPALQTAAANVARFDHNPVTGESLGLLIEEQRTNLFLHSEDLTNSGGWAYANVTRTSNTNVAPDGNITADTWTVTANGASTVISNSVTITPGSTVTHSVFMKKAVGADWVYLALRAPDANHEAGVFINIVTGEIGSNSVLAGTQVQYVANSAFAQNVGNGWFRISASFATNVATAVTASVRASRSNGNTSNTLAGDSYFIWGRKGEVGAFPTSYIPTVASQVTRSADSASMTGSNFSSWYRADEGTLYAEAVRGADVDATIATIAAGATTTDRIQLHSATSSEYRATYRTSNVEQAVLTFSSSSNTPKIAATIKVNDLAGSLNAGAVATDSVATIGVYDSFYIGTRSDSTAHLNSTIKRIAYYPKRLSNTELQGLTS